jgi:hypothetical protein
LDERRAKWELAKRPYCIELRTVDDPCFDHSIGHTTFTPNKYNKFNENKMLNM